MRQQGSAPAGTSDRVANQALTAPRVRDFLNLEKGDHSLLRTGRSTPQMVVPTLIHGGVDLFQFLAIFEYLEETYPEPPLL